MESILTPYGDPDSCLAQLDSSRDRILALVTPLDDTAFFHRPDEETWSVAMVLEHIAMAESSAARTIRALARVANGGSLPAFHVEPGRRRPDGRPIAPDIVTPKGEMSREAVMAKLSDARESLHHQVREGRDLLDHEVTVPHPFFGDLNGLGWLRMAAYHEPSHIDQIDRTIAFQGSV